MKRQTHLFTILFALLAGVVAAQKISPTPDEIKTITSLWTGERFADGRPKVPDALFLPLPYHH